MVKPGLYYSLKSQSWWRVYEPIGDKIPMIRMVTGATQTIQDMYKFNEAVESGSFVFDERLSSLLTNNNKPTKKTKNDKSRK